MFIIYNYYSLSFMITKKKSKQMRQKKFNRELLIFHFAMSNYVKKNIIKITRFNSQNYNLNLYENKNKKLIIFMVI